MGRKRKKYKDKKIDFSKIELSAEEEKKASIRSKTTVALSFLWPLTLFILAPKAKLNLPVGIYYCIILISGLNVVLTYYYSRSEIDEIKYEAYLRRNTIGKIERYSSFYVILEVAVILIYLAFNL